MFLFKALDRFAKPEHAHSHGQELDPVKELLEAEGVYCYRNSVFDIGIMILFSLVGYGMRKIEFPQAPVILGVLLGGAAESSLRQAMVISDGNPAIFVTRPLSAAFLCLTLASLILPPIFLRKRPKQD